MIPRYTPEDIGALWTDAARLSRWLQVELAVMDALAARGRVPKADQEAVHAAAKACDFVKLAARASEIEKTTHHDVIAFLTAFEELAGPPSRHVHFGLTSSDVVDTALAMTLVEAGKMIAVELSGLKSALKTRIEEHRRTPMMGRTHGIHAEPISFGLVLAGHYAEAVRNEQRLAEAIRGIGVGKLSGAVGTNAHLDLEVETEALTKLGLSVESVATQVVPRDRHAQFFTTLAILGASIERLALEVRHLQRTEVYEAEEPFAKGQKGSSAMPHKRNPILSENLTGLARLLRSWAQAALEDVALWHERDISHSSVERVIGPDATITAVFMLRRMKRLVEGLNVYPKNMRANLEKMRGLVFSQGVLLALAEKGLPRQQAYVMVQRNAMRVWSEEGLGLHQALAADAEIGQHLSAAELAGCFDLDRQLRNADALIDRVLGSG
ncbi:MAG: adenylosuccinate lyase [Myxococcota bacterium]